MTTKREYAVSLGLAKEGRGKLSRDAHAAIDKAEAEGTVFTDPVPVVRNPDTLERSLGRGGVRVTPAGRKELAERFARAPKDRDLLIDSIADSDDGFNVQERIYPEGQMWKSESGLLVNSTQVCSPCGVSLGWHSCGAPFAVTAKGMEAVKLA